MKNTKSTKTGAYQKTGTFSRDDRSGQGTRPDINTSFYQDTEKDLNAKILKITQMIRDEYPELSSFLNEMPITVPDDEHPDVELDSLKGYYDSLTTLLSKYRLEHPRLA